MSWNYRVIRRTHEGKPYYGIHEVYYDPNGAPEMWTEDSMRPFGESIEELQHDLEWMQKAVKEPILQEVTQGEEEVLEEI